MTEKLLKEVGTDYLLIDDRRGRKFAKINQMKTVGSLGLFLQAKRIGLISRIISLMKQITTGPAFLSEKLIQTVLELTDETIQRDKVS